MIGEPVIQLGPRVLLSPSGGWVHQEAERCIADPPM